MFSIEIACPPEQNDMLVAELWAEGSTGIVELEGGGLRAFFEDDADRAALATRFHAVSWRREEQRDWVAMSRANWEPLLVGERFFLVPVWRSDLAPEGRFRIAVNPGMAFGTGMHETTQLCLEALEMYVRPGAGMLDVGTGSGILAQAAALLGAGPVWACDIDPEAVEIARSSAGSNLFIGSVDAVRSGAAGVIAANISPEAIARLAPELMRCLGPDGVALLSGLERHEVAAVQSQLERLGGSFCEARYKGSWALVVAKGKLVGEA
ncbi:MAG: 50S ribosomal protein L11 methyltransferase [Bryobacteraceae bacterium]|jgi:ribosomal protein L11 methyltransferase